MKLAVAFVIASLLFAVMERLWPAIPGQRWLRRGFWTDVLYWFFTPLVSGTVTFLGLVLVLFLVARLSGVHVHGKGEAIAWLKRPTWLSAQPRWKRGVIVLLISDFLGYWQHRLFHTRRFWKFHAIHHSSTELDWLSSVRLHPLNELGGALFSTVPLVLIGFNPLLAAGTVPFLQIWAVVTHANLSWTLGPFRYVLAGPAFHRWHHTSEAEGLDKNLAGYLPLWDLLFGTFYMPAGKQPVHFGVRRETIPEGLIGQTLYPFRKASPGGSRPA